MRPSRLNIRESVLKDPRADATAAQKRQRRLSEIQRHVLRIFCRRCERMLVEIQTADADPIVWWQRGLEGRCAAGCLTTPASSAPAGMKKNRRGTDPDEEAVVQDGTGERPRWAISERMAETVLGRVGSLWRSQSDLLEQLQPPLRVAVVEQLARYLTYKQVPFLLSFSKQRQRPASRRIPWNLPPCSTTFRNSGRPRQAFAGRA